jgi:hypothetical protein
MDATTTQRNMQSDQRWAGQALRPAAEVLDAGLGSPEVPKATGQLGVGAARSHYLLRLTGRLSLVCACFFLLQPVRLY